MIWQLMILLAVSVPGIWDDEKAPDAPVPEQKVQVTVIAILATDQNDKVDPRLTCIATEVQKKEPSLTGFQLAQTSKESVAVGKPTKFALVDKEIAEISVRHGANKDDRISLKVKLPQLGEITYTSACGKFLPIFTRYQTKDNETLIIAIMVKPCRGEKK